MIYLEAALLTLLVAVLCAATYTDCRTGRIKNSLILGSAVSAAVLDGLYYGLFAGEFFRPFLINAVVLIIAAFFFYAYHLWAAGDSKLLFVVSLCIPGRLYTFWDIGIASGFFIMILIFSIAFFYVVGESVWIGIRHGDLFRLHHEKIDYFRVLVSYFSMVSAIFLLNWVIWSLFSRELSENQALSAAVSFFMVLTLSQLRDRFSNRGLLAAAVSGWLVIGILVLTGLCDYRMHFELRSWVLVLVIMLIRMIAEKYNYQTIPTCEVRAGQILSAMTVLSFRTSRVQGLPTGMTEDLRSRLTEEEAESVRRWESSKSGKSYLVIVRKIPFAVFVSLGSVLFVMIEVMMA